MATGSYTAAVILLTVAASVASVSLAAPRPVSGPPAAYAPPPETAALAPGPGVELATGYCQMCHSVDYITTQPRGMGAAFWEGSVNKMRRVYGAPISDAEARTIVDYLNAAYSEPAG